MRWYWICVFFFGVTANAQTIVTVGGTGSSVFSGEGVSATIAGIPNPRGAAFDKYGNFYFTDGTGSHRVRKVDVFGTITTVAGNGVGGYNNDGISATSAKLNYPGSVIFDTVGDFYIADIQNFRVRKVNVLTGIITTIAGIGVSGFGGDGGAATAAMITGPADICLDKFGNLFVADAFNYRIRKINSSGIITTYAGIGTMGSSGDGGLATAAQINIPQGGLATDDSGNLYIAERGGNKVRKINSSGVIQTIAGNGLPTYVGDGIPATSAQIVPLRIGFNSSRQLYICDDYNQRIYQIDSAGIIHCIVGNGVGGYSGDGGPATAAQVSGPAGISFDQCSNLFFPEFTSRRIREVIFNPTCSLSPLKTEITSISKNISVYPNPVIDELQIENALPKTEYRLTNVVGVLQQRGNLKQGNNIISLKQLPPGMYMLVLTDEEGKKIVNRIVKE